MLMLPNFEHSEVLIRMTDKMLLLLASRDKFVTLNIFDRIFSVDFPTREDWSTECVDMVAPDGLVFFTDGSLCGGRAGAGVFSDILNVWESYALGSHATVFQSKVYAILACSEYSAFVHPGLEYASCVWSPHQEVHSARIERIQHNFVRFALRGLSWTAQPLPPYESRCLLLGLEVLSDRKKIAAALFVRDILCRPPTWLICCVLRVIPTQGGGMLD
jgi:hypothetical protein